MKVNVFLFIVFLSFKRLFTKEILFRELIKDLEFLISSLYFNRS